MADHSKLSPFIRKWEGKFVNDPTDLGGATMSGVTFATFQAYRKNKGLTATIEDLKNITDAEWNEIFKGLYWDRWQADRIRSQSVANVLVDWVWASGKWGIIVPQRILGLKADGIVGDMTIAAVNSQDPYLFFLRLIDERREFVNRIVKANPSQQKFIFGWLNRINDFRFVA